MLPQTQTLEQVFAKAQDEARERLQEFVSTEHLAMALLESEKSEAGRVLAQMNLQAGYVRNILSHTLPSGTEAPVVTGRLPMSPKAQRLVSNALVAAQAAQQTTLSTRMLLSAVLAEAGGVVCESFRRAGADLNELTKALREKVVDAEP